MGRVMIFHQPRVQPVREGKFQVIFVVEESCFEYIVLPPLDTCTPSTHPTVGAEQKILKIPELLTRGSSMSHPKHYFEDVRSRKPPNSSVR